MEHYQTHLFDNDGEIVRSQTIVADTDVEALRDAKRFVVNGYKLEIWEGERKVGSFNEPK